MGRIVVGVDGSEPAQRALHWAAQEAATHGHVLEVVTATPPEVIPGGVWVTPRTSADALLAVKQVQADALAELDLGGIEVVEHREVGFPAERLLAHATGADLVVLGSRGFGAIRGALLGSVSRQVATHTNVPVVVVPDIAPSVRHVLVGVDGSDHSRTALRWAHAEAKAHGATLEAVSVQPWSGVAVGSPWTPLAVIPDIDETRDRVRERLEAAVDEETGDDSVVRTVLEGVPSRALLEAAESADLLVVGRRGLGGFERLLLGSVSARCLTHGPCPVAVIPGGRS